MLRVRRGLPVLLLWSILGRVTVSNATTVTLTAAKDNTLYEDAAGSVSDGIGSFVFAGRTDQQSGAIRRSLIAFDVSSGLPGNARITSVMLRVHVSRVPTLDTTQHAFALHAVLADWGEGTSGTASNDGQGQGAASTTNDATWIHRFFNTSFWATPGGDFEATVSSTTMISDIGFYTWPSTSQLVADVQHWVDNPTSNFGWIVIGDEATHKSARRFDSRENVVAENRPVLTVEFVSQDCNQNGVPDDADVAGGASRDCNQNGIPDECETDSDGDGVIDACDNCPQVPNPNQDAACGSMPSSCGSGLCGAGAMGSLMPLIFFLHMRSRTFWHAALRR